MPEVVSTAERERVREIIARLRKTYPEARCSLNFSTPLELLVATILTLVFLPTVYVTWFGSRIAVSTGSGGVCTGPVP